MHRRIFLTGLGALPLAIGMQGALAQSTPANGDFWAHPEWFTTPDQLGDHDGTGWRTVALTPANDFQVGHIPGSARLDWPDLELLDSSDESVQEWMASISVKLAQRGISATTAVDMYDGGTFYAARLWWVLDVLGHANKYILDGGLSAWTDAGKPIETGSAVVMLDAPPYTASPNLESLMPVLELEDVVESGAAILIDARNESEFSSGHIPGAINVPFLENSVPESGGKWKSPSDLLQMYASLGVTPDKQVIPYCSTGVRSATTWFTLRALGFQNVRLFSGSYTEWTSDPTRSVETGN